ncbi:signal recognition particle-docking protein FtsY [Shewanella gelidii]|uniref:Signal recognition particle receptor FtsY n=1 Tax=Shewanella gelidii TaxID=1642821 RepID=A0A917JTZ2_9GAMM|nr:signal recognition particle-docking protein FtsY [Shewanella gelidii]MCL1098530.1 signal recognition particle-docking protein FtsY [Shewanella gelidii]GGI82001.1 hypothetical protein GCM10009332_19080 [Shewanella gelidii]
MAKKGFFSWFRKDKPEAEVEAETEVVSDLPTEQTDEDSTSEQIIEPSSEQALEPSDESGFAGEAEIEPAAEENVASDEVDAPKTAVDESTEIQQETEVTVVEDEDDDDEAVVIEEEATFIEAEPAPELGQDLEQQTDSEELDVEGEASAQQRIEEVEEANVEATVEEADEAVEEPVETSTQPQKQGFFARFKRGFEAEQPSEPQAEAASVSDVEDTAPPEPTDNTDLATNAVEPAVEESKSQAIAAEVTELVEGESAAHSDDVQVEDATELEDIAAQFESEQASEQNDIELVEEQSADEVEVAEVEESDAEESEAELDVDDAAAESEVVDAESDGLEAQPEPQARPQKEGFFARLKRGLLRTSENIGSGFIGLFKGKKIDDDLFEELEEQLLIADVGVETTTRLIEKLTDHASRKQLKDAEALYELMQEEMQKTLEPVSIPLVPENSEGPFVILMVGVNGVGKTTTIGKLAKQYQSQGKSVMLAAGDTFRAAAVEQLQVWGQRNEIPVIAQHTGADSASVLFDALQAAKARNVDVLIADTAGRLQNKGHLMEELKKVVRVMQKLDATAPHEVMLTLDASTGQNAISQAQLFQEAVGVSGITITKLDGTAKGGVIFAIADKFGIPIRHIGVGEQIDDLRVFEAKSFIDALFSQENN